MKNLSDLDRGVRAVLAIALAVSGFSFFSGTFSIIAYVLAVVLIVTALTGFCPLYKILGINTAKQKK